MDVPMLFGAFFMTNGQNCIVELAEFGAGVTKRQAKKGLGYLSIRKLCQVSHIASTALAAKVFSVFCFKILPKGENKYSAYL